jgi:hypothetical protein
MDALTKKIKKLNELYFSFKKNFEVLRQMFKNHSVIKQKVILAEEMTNQIYMTILDKIEALETRREFNHIVKDIKNGQKKRRK